MWGQYCAPAGYFAALAIVLLYLFPLFNGIDVHPFFYSNGVMYGVVAFAAIIGIAIISLSRFDSAYVAQDVAERKAYLEGLDIKKLSREMYLNHMDPILRELLAHVEEGIVPQRYIDAATTQTRSRE